MTEKDFPKDKAEPSPIKDRQNIENPDISLQEKISRLQADIKEKNYYINFLKTENMKLSSELDQIKTSLTWKLLLKFHYTVVEKLIPLGTTRRSLYYKVIEGLSKRAEIGKEPVKAEVAPCPQFVDEEESTAQKNTVFPYEPKISIVVPTYNMRSDYLTAMIQSVKNQTYSNWELCIADGGSTNPEVKSVLESHASDEARIKIKFLHKNKGIPGHSNEAISLASGDYIALLDSDDTLTPSALFEIVKSINENPYARFIYSDYAITDEYNRISSMAFGPDFCRYYYLSHPYIVHLVVIRKELIDKIEGFDEAEFNMGVSHDVDLFLRIFALLDDKEIVHVPKILYLWKHYSKSSGHLSQDKVHKFTKKAIDRYLTSKKIEGRAEDGLCFNTFRARLKIKDNPLVSIIIPTKDKWEYLKKCIKSIESRSGYKNYEIIVIKNNTADKKALEYLETLKGRYRVEEYDKPFNYSAINNYGKNFARGDLLLFLNDDIEFKSSDTLTAMVELIQLDEVGAVGAKLLFPNNTIQHAGVIIGLRGVAEHWHKFLYAYLNKSLPDPGYLSSLVSIREYSAVTGAFLITKRSIFEKIGGFSEELKIGFNDVDFCLKIINKGYKILYTPYALAYHYESASRRDSGNKDLLTHPDDREVFIKKWSINMERGDPYYNPNLDTFSYIPIPKVQ
jgi:O-antigen biosynthesis protein